MNRVSYEIRTRKNVPVYTFDCQHRARQELVRAEARLKIRLRLVEVSQIERELSA